MLLDDEPRCGTTSRRILAKWMAAAGVCLLILALLGLVFELTPYGAPMLLGLPGGTLLLASVIAWLFSRVSGFWSVTLHGFLGFLVGGVAGLVVSLSILIAVLAVSPKQYGEMAGVAAVWYMFIGVPTGALLFTCAGITFAGSISRAERLKTCARPLQPLRG